MILGAEDARDEDRFVQTLRDLLARERDPVLHDRVWDYREGTISRTDLYRDEAFRRAMSAWYDEALAEQAARGFTPDRVRERLAALAAEGRLDPRVLHPHRSPTRS